MNRIPQQQRAGTRPVDIKAQLAIAEDPVFPFSSPIPDHRSSTDSSVSDRTLRTQSPVGPKRSAPANSHGVQVPANSSYRISPGDHRGVSGALRRLGDGKPGRDTHVRNKPRPNLHIVTDSKQLLQRQGKIVLNQVAVRRPQEVRRAVVSVISQKGIKALPTPLTLRETSEPTSRSKHSGRPLDSNVASNSENTKANRKLHGKKPTSPLAKRSVIFGLSLPEHEAKLHSHAAGNNSTVTLVTAETPYIIVTPIEEEAPQMLHVGSSAKRIEHLARPSSASSLYSSIVIDESPRQSAYPPPLADPSQQQRRSLDSQQQTLVGNGNTPRPKSEGWWNLLLSPILSRMGTLKSQRHRSGNTIPPVPAIKTAKNQDLPMKTPALGISPETPRRLGLADVRTSTWSQWTETECEKDFVDDHHSDTEQDVPVQPRDCLAHDSAGPTELVSAPRPKNEGLAAEYYHACAVEQLANITYFECINHSCVDRLPKLQSIFDMHEKKLPFDDFVVHNKEKSEFKTGFTNGSHHYGREGNFGQPDVLDKVNNGDKTASLNSVGIIGQKIELHSPDGTQRDQDEIVSPNVRQAKTAVFSKAKPVNSRDPSPDPAFKNDHTAINKVKIVSTAPALYQPAVESPGPMSPEAARIIAPTGALSMSPLQNQPANSTVPLFQPVPQSRHALVNPFQPPPSTYHPYGSMIQQQFPTPPPPQYATNYSTPPAFFQNTDQPHLHMMQGPHPTAIERHHEESSGVDHQIRADGVNKNRNNKKQRKKFGIFGCIPKRKAKQPKARRRLIGIAVLLIAIIIGCILFAIFFVRGNGNANPIDSQWLNLSGYPPLPTGISTIAQPNLAASQNRCTEPTTLWSCTLPKEDQVNVGLNSPNQPNFRFQIRFLNGTVPANMTIPLNKRADDPSANNLFAPNPTPPGKLDQIFLGNTTDNVTRPFDGETTPFFVTFMTADVSNASASNVNRGLSRRQSSSDNSLDASIPAPAIGPDGSAAPSTLLPTAPFPFSQPLKLYNRGLRDEHYGFYIYYDKSIFLSGIVLQSGNSSAKTLPADQDGGSFKQAASARCTWSQTRYVVKIFTNQGFGAKLLPGATINSSKTAQEKDSTSSATNFNRPGSFPYPTTILLDRHGGDVNKKLVYCYGMNNGNIVNNAKVLVSEIRSFGGVLVNPSPQLLNQGGTTFDSSLGGIDGGTGGCGCTWQNWQ